MFAGGDGGWVRACTNALFGQSERRPHAPHHCRRNKCVPQQLVALFEHSWFRYDASQASSWLQASIVNFATTQIPRRYSSSAKMGKLFLILVELARILVAFLQWAFKETCWKVIGVLTWGMILRIHLVHHYSSKFGNNQRSSLSPTWSVNTATPIQQNPMHNGHDDNKGHSESYENKCATNYNITHKQQLERHSQQTTHNAQPMTTLTSTIACVESASTRTVPHLMVTPHTSWLKFWVHSQSFTVFLMARSLWLDLSFLPLLVLPAHLLPLNSTTGSSWQVKAIPPQKRVRTPWTPSPLPHMSKQLDLFI